MAVEFMSENAKTDWLINFSATYQKIVPAVCEFVHRSSAGVLCGYMAHTIERLSGSRLSPVPGVVIGRQYEGQAPEEGGYMAHWWCEDEHGEIVDFAPLNPDFLWEYVPASHSDKYYLELSELMLQPMNKTVYQWHEDFDVLRQTEQFGETIQLQVEMSRSNAARLNSCIRGGSFAAKTKPVKQELRAKRKVERKSRR
ncbi:hypothetical protein [Rubinisphaera sp. JC750]|uniref:hypothetical protein n=1 Tax=Rubinisphaera sp. JC750 TaxID=2898658 RepID=UPI001F35E6CB|nr:hypothetical protein [Rubinisphaera sp. JC750]